MQRSPIKFHSPPPSPHTRIIDPTFGIFNIPLPKNYYYHSKQNYIITKKLVHSLKLNRFGRKVKNKFCRYVIQHVEWPVHGEYNTQQGQQLMGNEREMGYRTGLIGEKVEARKRRRSREGLTGFDKSVGNNGPECIQETVAKRVNGQLLPVSEPSFFPRFFFFHATSSSSLSLPSSLLFFLFLLFPLRDINAPLPSSSSITSNNSGSQMTYDVRSKNK